MDYMAVDRIKQKVPFVQQDDDDMIICRCEEITKGEIRRAIYDGMLTVNEIKRYIRPGMGLCQGLTCGRLVKDILARELKARQEQVEEATARSPQRPVMAKVFADAKE